MTKNDTALRRARVVAELKREVRLANDRIARIAKAGRLHESFAYDYLRKQRYDKVKYVEKKGDLIKYKSTVKGRSLRSLEAELKNVKRFNQSRTATLRGIDKLQKESYNTFIEHQGMSITREQYNEFWKDVRIQNFKKMYGSEQLVNQIRRDGTGDVARYIAERVAERGKKYSIKQIERLAKNYESGNRVITVKDFRI